MEDLAGGNRRWRNLQRARERVPTDKRAMVAAAKRDDRDGRRKIYHAMKSAPCADCRQTFDPVCMDFDHRGEEAKLFTISRMALSIGLDKLRAEVAKCDLVCANCHRLRTKNRQ